MVIEQLFIGAVILEIVLVSMLGFVVLATSNINRFTRVICTVYVLIATVFAAFSLMVRLGILF